jgi:electron transfer flavoprotein beta subunit
MEEAVSEDTTSIRVGRQVEGGLEVFDVPLPCLVTAQKGMNEPRYPTLKGIMGAKKKEVKDLKVADLAGLGPVAPTLEVVALEALPPRPPGRILTGDPKDMARELVRTLREDVKAI